ncbi:hypothetical protein B0H17DRAFT_1200801 [Mycena rosella]|uniref:Methyltransferase domain-containing protein n=1 Tax=Mycena rosella TaxID=1033263 RepID=A0AAD7DHV1_MYCRO|nr:hypothetical protein B0H17DRAFT_1200801 [Mycena rosella]
MSSRAASGRKRLRPAAAATAPLPVPTAPQSTNGFSRTEVDSNVYYTSPQSSPNPASPMYFRSGSSPSASPSTPSFSFSSRSPASYQSPAARDLIPRSQRASEAAGGLTPYPLPSQTQVYQPPPLRREKAAPFRTSDSSYESPSPQRAPSYATFSPNFSDSEGGDSRHSSMRALPPYPSKPPVKTGWATLSDVKVAGAMAVPPSYPDDPQREARRPPYPSPLHSPFGSEASGSRPGSLASSSRLAYAYDELPETPRAASHPPYYSPPASPLLLSPRSRATGPSSPPSSKRTAPKYSAPPYPTPPSSFSSPSTSSASLYPTSRRLETHHEGNHSGSSDSLSAGSLASRANPAMRSSHSISSSSSTKSAPAPATKTEAPPPPPPPPPGSFVFPSSRSRARPNGATPGGFKFRGRRKLKTPLATVQVLAPGTPIPAEGVFTAQALALPQPKLPAAPAKRAPPPQNLRLAPTVSTSSGSGSSGSGSILSSAAATPAFYFPSSRTRAHPKSPTKFSMNKDKGKKKALEGGSAKPQGFLRMGFRKAAVAAQPLPAVGPESAAERDESPMERTFAMQQDERYGTPTPERGGSYTYEEDLNSPNRTSMSPPPQVATKIGTYPLDAYDAALMESDRETWELLRKLNATNTPSFHNYGGRPPRSVLDLGCGAGHWMLDAATAWRNSGVQIVGLDMVDTTKGLWPVAQRKGVANNLKFVRGNFVKQELPFSDGSFQLVRMSSLALCIPHEQWEFVLQQVWRVLAVGGRLELIDDHVFFPYGKPPLLTPSGPPPSQSFANAPHLDMMIPSSDFSRMSLADVVNPVLRDDTDSEIYNLYGVEEEGEEDDDPHSDADTIGSGRRRGTPTPYSGGRSSSSLSGGPPDAEAWHEQAASARELEALFEHMMNVKFGIHLRPSEFVVEMLGRIFGRAQEVAAMHLTLAPPEPAVAEATQHPASLNGRSRGRVEPAAGLESDTLGHCPGLILWPSTFIPMPLPELETHASKHLRMLLSCRSALVEYASEIADRGEGEAQSEAAMEALWEYQNFLRERFNPPPDGPSRAMSDASSSAGDANSIRNSIYSVSSVGSDAREAMREYQNELHNRFEWGSDAARDTAPMPTPVESPSAPAPAPPRVRKSRSRGSRGRDRAASVVSSVAPPYSRIELTHVRTFYVYEAVKLDGGFGGMI